MDAEQKLSGKKKAVRLNRLLSQFLRGHFVTCLVFRKVDGEMIWEASDSLTQKKVNCVIPAE